MIRTTTRSLLKIPAIDIEERANYEIHLSRRSLKRADDYINKVKKVMNDE